MSTAGNLAYVALGLQSWVLFTALGHLFITPARSGRGILSDLVSRQACALLLFACAAVCGIGVVWDLPASVGVMASVAGGALMLVFESGLNAMVRLAGACIRPQPAAVRLRSAWHEAGHAAMYAMAQHWPATLDVRIGRRRNTCFTRTYLAGHWEHSEDTLYWLMLVALAGAEAERIGFGTRATGAEDDMQTWNVLAHIYLRAGFGDVYFGPPCNQSERRANLATLNALRKRMRDEVAQYLEANRQALRDLAETVNRQTRLDRHAMEPLLAAMRVERTYDVTFYSHRLRPEAAAT